MILVSAHGQSFFFPFLGTFIQLGGLLGQGPGLGLGPGLDNYIKFVRLPFNSNQFWPLSYFLLVKKKYPGKSGKFL